MERHCVRIKLPDGEKFDVRVPFNMPIGHVIDLAYDRGLCGAEHRHNLHLQHRGEMISCSDTAGKLFGLLVRPGHITLSIVSVPTYALEVALPTIKNAEANDGVSVYIDVHVDVTVEELLDSIDRNVCIGVDPRRCCIAVGDKVEKGNPTMEQLLGERGGQRVLLRAVVADDGDGGDGTA